MSNVYLKVTIEKKGRTQNFDFKSLKSSSPGQFCGSPTHADIVESQLKSQRSENQTVCDFSIIFILKGIVTF